MSPRPKHPRRLNDADTTFLHVGAVTGTPIAPCGVTVLEGPVDRSVREHYLQLMVQAFPNARSRIVRDRLSLALPRWVDIPGFEPMEHIEDLEPPGDGTYRAVLDWAEEWAAQPFPDERAPWRYAFFDGVLVDGVERTVSVMQSHHAFTDGEGGKRHGLKLRGQLVQTSADDELPPLEPSEPIERIGPVRRWFEGWGWELRGGAFALAAGGRRVGEAVRHPKAAVARVKRVAHSIKLLREDMGSNSMSPLLRRRSTKLQFDHLEIDIPALKAGAKSVGGTVNDGFLAAIALGLRAWHADHGVEIPEIRTSMAVNLRTKDDDSLGNNMIAVVLRLPLDSDDAAEVVKRCGELSRRHRTESDGMKLMRIGQTIGNRLPRRVIENLTRKNMGGMDVQLSNLIGTPPPRWAMGREILKGTSFPVGTLSGLAVIMVHKFTRTDLGMITDPEAVTDREHFVECILGGFDQVAALAPGDV
jgi:diacylglycerol O-acyltransferase